MHPSNYPYHLFLQRGRHYSTFSRLQNGTHEPSTDEPNGDFPFPQTEKGAVSTALVSLEAAGRWRLSLYFQLISELWAAQLQQMLILIPTVHGEVQQKSYSLFDPPNTWFSIRSQCQLLPVKKMKKTTPLKHNVRTTVVIFRGASITARSEFNTCSTSARKICWFSYFQHIALPMNKIQ